MVYPAAFSTLVKTALHPRLLIRIFGLFIGIKRRIERGGAVGEAVPKAQSEIQILALQNYVCNRVSELTGGLQEPTVHLSGAKNFVIARRAGA